MYRQAESGMILTGSGYANLKQKVAQHRQVNGYPLGNNLDQELQTWLWERMTPDERRHWCRETDRPYRRSVLIGDLERFVTDVAAWAVNGTLAPQEEADRRAGICADCPWNEVVQQTCGNCRRAIDVLSKFLLGRKTKVDDTLRACRACRACECNGCTSRCTRCCTRRQRPST